MSFGAVSLQEIRSRCQNLILGLDGPQLRIDVMIDTAAEKVFVGFLTTF